MTEGDVNRSSRWGYSSRFDYSSRKWRMARADVLKDEPLCRFCKAQGVTRLAEIVDHVVPIESGGAEYERSNLQPLCRWHHHKKSVWDRQDKSHRVVDKDGLPLDPRHPWNEE